MSFPFDLVLFQFILLFQAMLLVSPVNLNILLVIFQFCSNCLKIISILYFLRRQEDKGIAVEKNLAEYRSMSTIRRSTCISSMETKDIFSF